MDANSVRDKEDLELIQRIRNDPWEFSKYVFTIDESDKLNPIKRFPYELAYVKLYFAVLLRETRIAVPKSRRMKMTWINVIFFLWDTMWHGGRHNAIVSKKEDDADWLIASRFKFVYDNLDKRIPRQYIPKAVYKYNKLIFTEINSLLQGFPQGADQMRMYTFSNIFADELAFWEKAEDTYSASLPTLEGGGRFVGISSPGPGFFKRLVQDNFDEDNVSGKTGSNSIKKRYPIQGVELWRNPINEFLIFQLHYTADPNKRSKDFRDGARKGLSLKKFNQEYELYWDTYVGHPVYTDFNKIIHGSKEKLYPKLGLPLLRGWDFGLCYDDETEVLTDDGWKFFKDVNIEKDKVMTLDPEGFKCCFEKPSMKIDKYYNGAMYECEGTNLNFNITEDHIVPYWSEAGYFKKDHAKDILEKPGHNKLRLTGSWEGSSHSNELKMDSHLFASFMGLYLSEGSVEINKNRVAIYQNDNNMGWVDDILNPTSFCWSEEKDCRRVSDKHLAEYLRKFGRSGEKYIPWEIKNSKKSVIEDFIDAYTMGDGHVRTRPNGSEEHTIFTKSKRMADDFQEIALKVGWNSRIREIEETEYFYEKENRMVKSGAGYSISFKKRANFAELRSYSMKKKNYKGRVYCLSVPTNILYVRRRGVPHFNGNTPACVIAQMQEDTLVILREFTAKNMGIERFSDIVLPACATEFPSWHRPEDYIDLIDAAGFFRTETDENTCAKVLKSKGLKPIAGEIGWEKRRKSVEDQLTKIVGGMPCFVINLAECPMLVKGFLGGYRYPKDAMDLEQSKIKPLKDEHSHAQDGLQMITSKLKTLGRVKPKAPRRPNYKGRR